MAHSEYGYTDCWRQALILDVIRPYSSAVLFKYSGILAGVNGSDGCAVPFSLFPDADPDSRRGRGGPGVRRGVRKRGGLDDACVAGLVSAFRPCSRHQSWDLARHLLPVRDDVTWVRLSPVTVAGTGSWRPGCHLLPGCPGLASVQAGCGYWGGSGGRNRAADRTAEADADDEAPERC